MGSAAAEEGQNPGALAGKQLGGDGVVPFDPLHEQLLLSLLGVHAHKATQRGKSRQPDSLFLAEYEHDPVASPHTTSNQRTSRSDSTVAAWPCSKARAISSSSVPEGAGASRSTLTNV